MWLVMISQWSVAFRSDKGFAPEQLKRHVGVRFSEINGIWSSFIENTLTKELFLSF